MRCDVSDKRTSLSDSQARRLDRALAYLAFERGNYQRLEHAVYTSRVVLLQRLAAHRQPDCQTRHQSLIWR